MLCTDCRLHTADTDTGLCADCAHAAAPDDVPTGPASTRPLAALVAPVGLARATVVLLGLCIAVDVVSLFADAFVFVSADDLATRRAVDLYDRVIGLQGLALFVCGIVFVQWLRAARLNAEVFRPDVHRLSRGWTFWGWIAPVVNLWYPRRVVLDIWTASTPRPADGSAPRISHGLINAWWACWLVGHMANLAPQLDGDGTDGLGFRDSAVSWAVYDTFDIAAAALAIVLVRTLTRMQQVRAAQGPGLPFL